MIPEAQRDLEHTAKLTPSLSERKTDKPGRSWEWCLSKSLLALTLLSGISLTFYIFVSYRVLFHSDAAMMNLLAGDIIRTGQFFPSDWYYINDIWILFPHIFIVPLALIFPNSFILHAIACFCFTLLFAGSLYLLCNTSGLQRNDFLFAISLLFTGLSTHFAEYLFGQSAYIGTVASTFVLIALVFRTLQAHRDGDRKKLRLWSALLVVFLSILLAGGVRTLFANVLPIAVTLALMVLAQQAGRVQHFFSLRSVLYTASLITLAVFLGGACFFAIRSGVHFQNDQSAPRFVDYEHLKENIGLFFEGFLTFAGAMPTANKNPVSVYGGITAYRLFWFSLVLLLPFWLLSRYRSITNPHFQFVLIYYAFSFLTTFYLYVFSSLPIGVETFRYFNNQCILAIVVLGYTTRELRLRFGAKSVCLALAACLPIYADSYRQLIAPYFEASVTSGQRFGLHRNPRQPLADYLVAHNLRYGYATYWNAGVLSVLSKGRTRVNGILIGDNPPVRPFRWLSPASAYASDAFQGKTFLLLTDQEYEALNKFVLDSYLGPPESVQAFSGYRIMVYGFNIADRLPGWNFVVDQRYAPADLKADVECNIDTMKIENGQRALLQVQVTNEGSKLFASDGQFPIDLGVHLYTKDRHNDLQMKSFDYLRAGLQHRLKPGETSVFPVPLTALPQGEYVLEISMVQEGVAWFGTKKNGQPLHVDLTVR